MERYAYQVFLSFRGTDVRKTFISHLLRALKERGIITFYDDFGLPRGEYIQSQLYKAIETSKLSIVTFSPGYADSRWCLDELVKIMGCKSSHGHDVLPVFFGVDPTHLRKQSGPYQDAFDKHEKDFGDDLDRVIKWRLTLTSAADLAGFCLQNKANGYEVVLIEHIIEEVVKKLDERQLSIPKHMVGAELLSEKISSWLQIESSEIEVGIIYGLGGVGKTTIAKIVFNRNQFKFSCFLADITSASQKIENIVNLQEQLIHNLSGNQEIKIYNVHQGKEMIKRVIGTKKALIVFDDVEDVKQLHAMFDSPDWFFPGSKILITTRNQHLINVVGVSTVAFEVCALNDEESTELFCHHAFSQSYPLDNYINISKLFIKYCEGLPLALEVLASSLRNESLETWKGRYDKLMDNPNKTVHNVLKLSFDNLEDSNDEEVFLHLAFFMIGMKRGFALIILEGCGLHGVIGLQNLADKCLVSVDKYRGTLVMHNLIQLMAYQVVRQKTELGQRSRLLGQKDISQVLCKKTGTSAIKGLQLSFPSLNATKPFKTSAFKKMCNLDLLLLENVQLDGDFEDFPTMIKWLFWRGFPMQSIPMDLELDELVVLDMQASCLVNAWKGNKDLGALKILDLSYSRSLITTPDLSRTLKLECMFLKGCVNLIEVHESVGKLTNLMHLNAEGCVSLVRMHESFGNLQNLSVLNLKSCRILVSFPFPISVVELNLAGCSNLFLGNSDIAALSLPVPSIYRQSPFKCNFPFLTDLQLVDCGISRDVFELLSSAPSLKNLNLRSNPILMLSNTSMRHFSNLEDLDVGNCTKLQSISQLPRNCALWAELCYSLRRISYIYDPEFTSGWIYGPHCDKLVEIDYGCNDRLVVKLTDDMHEGHANQLGFPNLSNFVFSSILDDIKMGVYRAGTYHAYHLGDHLATLFDTISTDSELHYTVPSNQSGVQTLNLGFVGSGDNRGLSINHVIIKNITSAWEWTLDIYSGAWLDRDTCEVTLTWLSHWCIMEHREINPGDELHISAITSEFFWTEKWGIEIVYGDQLVDDVTTPLREKKIDQEEVEIAESSARPRLLDLSIYEFKEQLDNDMVQSDHKPREYHVPYRILLRHRIRYAPLENET